MGRTMEKAIVRNYGDMIMVTRGLVTENEIRTIEVDALVDTGATFFCLPPKEIEKLGLMYIRSAPVKTANGDVNRRIFGGAKIIIRERDVQMEVMESDEMTPPLIGYLILEALDFVVDPRTQGLIPNPAHDGKWVLDLY